MLGRRGRNSPANANRLWWSVSCCPGSAMATYAGSGHAAWELVVLGRPGTTAAAALFSHSGTSCIGRNDS